MPGVQIGRVGIWAFLDTAPATEVAEVAAELDELGYGAVWVPGDRRARPVRCSAPSCSRRAPRISAATGIASIYARGPLAMAAAWKTLGEAFPGRFLLGLGVSHAPMVEGVHRQPYHRAGRDDAALPRRDGRGDLHRAAPPTRCRARARGARAAHARARRASGPTGAHPVSRPARAHGGRARGARRRRAPRAGADRRAGDRSRRRTRGRPRLRSAYLGLPNYANNLLRLGYTQEELDAGADRVVDAVVAWGDVDAIRARVRAHHDAGADHVCVQVLPHDRGEIPRAAWRELAPALLSA